MKLDLSHQNLTSLPSIPENVEELDISYNNLSSIKKLPSKLKELNCSYNHIKNLPKLPSTLITLNCSHNRLEKLPSLPKALTYLNISGNYLTKKPKDKVLSNPELTLLDGGNFYKHEPVKDCYDSNLQESVDIDFYLISSKDNLVIKYKGKTICITRKTLLENVVEKKTRVNFNIKGIENHSLSLEEFAYLKNRDYAIYDFDTSPMKCFTASEYIYFT